MARRLFLFLAGWSLVALPNPGSPAQAQTLEATLLKEPVERLVQSVQAEGDPRRGAVLFHQPYLGCTQCHAVGQGTKPLGPDLTRWEQPPTAAHLVEAILQPSKQIRKGYETLIIERTSGQTQTGLLVEQTPAAVVLRDTRDAGRPTTIPRTDIAELLRSDQSLMPAGLVNVLASRQQFLDLVSYLREIISNFALPGHASRHNRVYGSGAGWWGFGLGATSAPWGQRLARPRTRAAYAEWLAESHPANRGTQAPGVPFDERLLVGLRRREGVRLADLAGQAGVTSAELGDLLGRWQPFRERGLLLQEGPRWRLSDPEGLALSNGVLRELVAWWEERTAAD